MVEEALLRARPEETNPEEVCADVQNRVFRGKHDAVSLNCALIENQKAKQKNERELV